MRYFAVYDKKANVFGQLFPSATYGTAERSFKDSITSSDSPHGKYPEDFALYFVADFDEASGGFDFPLNDSGQPVFEPPRLICEATTLI